MRALIKKQGLGILIIVAAALLLLPAVALAQDGEEESIDETGNYCDSPVAQYLVEAYRIDCKLMATNGVGLGEIMKAIHLSETLPGFEGDWEDLLALKQADLGWGQMKIASRLADGDPVVIGELLTLRQENEVGWGQIKQAQALADAGIYGSTLEAALELQAGMGWGDIKAELGLEGPPPWAGGGKEKKGNGSSSRVADGAEKNGHGPPPWAGGGKEKKGTGSPPWAGGGKKNGQ